jgi:hypothetical protein
MIKLPAEFCERFITFLSDMSGRYKAESEVQRCKFQTDRVADVAGIFYITAPKLPSTYMIKKSSVLWDITPCSSLKVNRRYGGTCGLPPAFKLVSCFEPEDGGDMFFRNVG